jgi:hypothetical protein
VPGGRAQRRGIKLKLFASKIRKGVLLCAPQPPPPPPRPMEALRPPAGCSTAVWPQWAGCIECAACGRLLLPLPLRRGPCYPPRLVLKHLH